MVVKKWEGACVQGWGGGSDWTIPGSPASSDPAHRTSFSLGWMLAWEGEVDTQPSWTAFALFSPILFPALTSSMNRGSSQL